MLFLLHLATLFSLPRLGRGLVPLSLPTASHREPSPSVILDEVFSLPSSSVSHLLLLRPLFLHLRFSTATSSIVAPGCLFLLRPCHAFGVFGKHRGRVPEELFGISTAVTVQRVGLYRFNVLVVAVRHFSFSAPEFPARPSKSRRKSGITRFITESAVESTLTTTTAAAMITRLKPVSYLRDIYFNILIFYQDFRGQMQTRGALLFRNSHY